MGPTLEETRRDLRYMPTQYLTQVVQTPNDRVIGDIPLKTLAGLELSRRAQMQNELAAMGAPNPQMPTVMDSTVQSLSPQPQQPMPPQGMPPQGMPPAPPPQQAAPQPQQPPPQPQQQQRPPQAKQPPIMGLPAMQAPKKMAGGGIIAFAEGDPVPPAEEATSTVGDALRKALQWFQDVGDPAKNPREIEAREIERAHKIKPGPFEAVTPSERTRREGESAQILKTITDKQAAPAKQEVVKAEGNKEPKIIKAPDQTSGLADLARMMGGMGGGGGFGGPSREESALRKQLLEGLSKQGPAQTEYIANARRMANELETARAPALSDEEREALEEKQYSKYQARSKPHFDMMQKLIDEEKEANNAGKESEFYQMLGKVGGSLMSSRGAFGPALGRAVGEGIDYSDKMDAARAAAERLRRSAQMDLLKARMADEKNDQKSAQEYLNERDRKLQAAFKIDRDAKIDAMNLRGKMADLEAGDERSKERTLSQLAALDQKREISDIKNAYGQQNAALRFQLGLAGLQQKGLPSTTEMLGIDKRADDIFSDPVRNPEARKYIASLKNLGGENLLNAIQMGTMKPNDPKFLDAVQAAKDLYRRSYLQGTRTGGGSSSVRPISEVYSQFGIQ